ncbi:hypothetical protein BRADI_5g14716v3, partial [Brachypodium distachyon]
NQGKVKLRLCIRNEYGTRTLAKPAVVLKSTALRHELVLRKECRKLVWLDNTFEIPTWAPFRENFKTMNKLV